MGTPPWHRNTTLLLILSLQSMVFLSGATGAWSSVSAAAATEESQAAKRQHEIKISLFGQPCLLQGPLEQAMLQAIHAISPEQTYTLLSLDDVRPDSPKFLKQNLERLKGVKALPPALERYRDRLGKRLEAQLAFLDGLHSAEESKKSAPFFNAVNKHLLTRQSATAKRFETNAKKLDQAKGHNAELSGQLFESYNELIEPDPEEEFHRAIQRLGAQYVCSFEQEHADESDGPEGR